MILLIAQIRLDNNKIIQLINGDITERRKQIMI
jgi:hypothetical protein